MFISSITLERKSVKFRGSSNEAGPADINKQLDLARQKRALVQDEFSYSRTQNQAILQACTRKKEKELKKSIQEEFKVRKLKNKAAVTKQLKLHGTNNPKVKAALISRKNIQAKQELQDSLPDRLNDFHTETERTLWHHSFQTATNNLPTVYQELITHFTAAESQQYIREFLLLNEQIAHHPHQDRHFITHLFDLPADSDIETLQEALHRWESNAKWQALSTPTPEEELSEGSSTPLSEISSSKKPTRKPFQLIIR